MSACPTKTAERLIKIKRERTSYLLLRSPTVVRELHHDFKACGGEENYRWCNCHSARKLKVEVNVAVCNHEGRLIALNRLDGVPSVERKP